MLSNHRYSQPEAQEHQPRNLARYCISDLLPEQAHSAAGQQNEMKLNLMTNFTLIIHVYPLVTNGSESPSTITKHLVLTYVAIRRLQPDSALCLALADLFDICCLRGGIHSLLHGHLFVIPGWLLISWFPVSQISRGEKGVCPGSQNSSQGLNSCGPMT